jgi:hypothetical protein
VDVGQAVIGRRTFGADPLQTVLRQSPPKRPATMVIEAYFMLICQLAASPVEPLAPE